MGDEITFEYAGEEWSTGTWMGKVKCPIDGCRGNAETVKGVKCHMNIQHGMNNYATTECNECGEEFVYNQTDHEFPRKYCSVVCANQRVGKWGVETD